MRSIFIATLVIAACSRTALDVDDSTFVPDDASADATVDASPDGKVDAHGDVVTKPPLCSASNCKGCCDSSGICQTGTGDVFCGDNGGKCITCNTDFHCQQVFDGHACVSKGGGSTEQCSYATCPSGCCGRFNNVSQDIYCFQGDGDYACGIGGQPCAECEVNNDTCSNHQCLHSVCGGGHCVNGCCLGSECLAGTDIHMCGTGAVACADCTKSNETCQSQTCKPPLCNSQNCTGCCVGDICATGTQTNACGTSGAACTDCSASKKTCTNGTCQ